ncbi:preprotein translocase subunit SecE [Candidatus Jorgensenbacteria bacterium GWA1_54_12]|uniref:Protein translocase subunit SecE n=1 Tax=Candidatus Jorgensenbacteria bacterium GWA1_54_12 TaxID=1798468 RepID=A0A1F6BLK6_9BACT|nr:MAG: preprotein translocase subunit SecE [Candidatus Jorgensenbacteria bacterium GWA1_54_12]
MLKRITHFFRESYEEFKRVSWPTRQETVRYTLFIIGFSIALALFLGLLDFIFSRGLETLL